MAERMNDKDKEHRIKRKFETVRSTSSYKKKKKLKDVITEDIPDNN